MARWSSPKGGPPRTSRRCSAKWGRRRCANPVWSRELCKGHYSQWRRGAEISNLRTFRPCSNTPRDILAWLEEEYSVSEADKCVEWRGALRNGYPCMRLGEGQVGVHRFVAQYTINRGRKLPNGSVVHHRCANKKCIASSHLQITKSHYNTAEMHLRKYYENRIALLEARLRKARDAAEVHPA